MANINPRSAWAIFKFRLTGEKLNLCLRRTFSCPIGRQLNSGRHCTVRMISQLHDALVNLFEMPFVGLLKTGSVSTFQFLEFESDLGSESDMR